MQLKPYLERTRGLVLEGKYAPTDVMRSASEAMADLGAGLDAEPMLAALLERENAHPTSTPEGVAFPHALIDGVVSTLVVPVRCEPGVRFGVQEHPPCELVFVMVGPAGRAFEHVRVLARLARLVHPSDARKRLLGVESGDSLVEALMREDAAHA